MFATCQIACKFKKLISPGGCCFLLESQNLTSKLQTNCIFIVIIETQTQPTWMIALEMISVMIFNRNQECSIDDFGSYTNISYLQTPYLALFALMDLLCDGDDNEGFLRTLLAQHLGLRQSTGLGDVLLLLLLGLENTLVTRKLVFVTFIVPKEGGVNQRLLEDFFIEALLLLISSSVNLKDPDPFPESFAIRKTPVSRPHLRASFRLRLMIALLTNTSLLLLQDI